MTATVLAADNSRTEESGCELVKIAEGSLPTCLCFGSVIYIETETRIISREIIARIISQHDAKIIITNTTGLNLPRNVGKIYYSSQGVHVKF